MRRNHNFPKIRSNRCALHWRQLRWQFGLRRRFQHQRFDKKRQRPESSCERTHFPHEHPALFRAARIRPRNVWRARHCCSRIRKRAGIYKLYSASMLANNEAGKAAMVRSSWMGSNAKVAEFWKSNRIYFRYKKRLKYLLKIFRRISNRPVSTNVRRNFRRKKEARIGAQAGHSSSSSKRSK